MVSITLYGGVAEVGGNKILVEDKDTRVMLDFGTRMGYESNFFAEFLKPRTNTAFKDRLTIGALPKISGIYREDYLRPDGMESLSSDEYSQVLERDSPLYAIDDLESFEEYRRANNRSFLDAVLVSHCHLDHTGDIEYLHPSIPMYCSRETEIMVNAIDDVTGFKSKAIESKSSEIVYNTGKAMFPKSPRIKHNETFTRPTHNLDDCGRVKLKDLTVTHFSQDHSVPGASSYLVETSDGFKILYTGDIRFHGTNPMTIDEYASKVGGSIDVMLCEGTRIDSERRLTESEIRGKIEDSIKTTEGLVFIDFSWKDTTRFETVRQAAQSTGRTFVINSRLAYILDKLDMFPENDDKLNVFLKRKSSCLYSPDDYKKSRHELGFSDSKDNIDMRHYENGLIAQDIIEQPEQYVVMLSYFDLGQIFDLADNNGKIENSKMIRAQCEPFSDDMELDEEQLINWLNTFGIAYDPGETRLPEGCTNESCSKLKARIDRSHVSGHASRPELKELIEKINPGVLIPIHTPSPEAFKRLVDEIDSDIKVQIPELGKTYSF